MAALWDEAELPLTNSEDEMIKKLNRQFVMKEKSDVLSVMFKDVMDFLTVAHDFGDQQTERESVNEDDGRGLKDNGASALKVELENVFYSGREFGRDDVPTPRESDNSLRMDRYLYFDEHKQEEISTLDETGEVTISTRNLGAEKEAALLHPAFVPKDEKLVVNPRLKEETATRTPPADLQAIVQHPGAVLVLGEESKVSSNDDADANEEESISVEVVYVNKKESQLKAPEKDFVAKWAKSDFLAEVCDTIIDKVTQAKQRSNELPNPHPAHRRPSHNQKNEKPTHIATQPTTKPVGKDRKYNPHPNLPRHTVTEIKKHDGTNKHIAIHVVEPVKRAVKKKGLPHASKRHLPQPVHVIKRDTNIGRKIIVVHKEGKTRDQHDLRHMPGHNPSRPNLIDYKHADLDPFRGWGELAFQASRGFADSSNRGFADLDNAFKRLTVCESAYIMLDRIGEGIADCCGLPVTGCSMKRKRVVRRRPRFFNFFRGRKAKASYFA